MRITFTYYDQDTGEPVKTTVRVDGFGIEMDQPSGCAIFTDSGDYWMVPFKDIISITD